jgi:hypothetical protein
MLIVPTSSFERKGFIRIDLYAGIQSAALACK